VANFLIDWLEKQIDFSLISGVGHRVVFGMKHTEPELITKELLNELHSIIPYDSDHLPAEIELIEVLNQRYPNLSQVACFDTAFHNKMPRVAKLLPIPRRFDKIGIQRYGFHGLSYAYIIEELVRVAGKRVGKGRVILAHLGNGASIAAVFKGKSIDTSMGFTPAGGMIMGTRPGDLDPGVAWYMMRSENLTPKQFNNLINHESGLLGISETSSDMRDLLAKESDDIRAAEAVALFCYQAKKWIGAFAAILGGLDTLVFAGGIGENCPVIRSRICEGLGFLGIGLEEKQNRKNAPIISKEKQSVVVRVIHTDEEWMIAKTISQILNITKK
jgi:acetate kinase